MHRHNFPIEMLQGLSGTFCCQVEGKVRNCLQNNFLPPPKNSLIQLINRKKCFFPIDLNLPTYGDIIKANHGQHLVNQYRRPD